MFLLCWDLVMHSNGACAQVRSLHTEIISRKRHAQRQCRTLQHMDIPKHALNRSLQQSSHIKTHPLPQFKSRQPADVTLLASVNLWKGSKVSNVCWSVTCNRVTRELTTEAINRSTAGNQTNGGQTSEGQFQWQESEERAIMATLNRFINRIPETRITASSEIYQWQK